ncbi:MAG: 30S ribosomal protein S15 [Candidatus Moranbacteria bacterium RBG_13_45_13]|nr:MAG: 30S ribosomal protein S15 [Candidatus Moranbacteria bacterium RBG_13_45_13]
MVLTKQKKTKVIETSKTHEKDTGSPEVQISLFTEKIKKLTSHLKKNKKDNHSRRGLLKMVSKRKKLLSYLKGRDVKRYKKLALNLGLKE